MTKGTGFDRDLFESPCPNCGEKALVNRANRHSRDGSCLACGAHIERTEQGLEVIYRGI